MDPTTDDGSSQGFFRLPNLSVLKTSSAGPPSLLAAITPSTPSCSVGQVGHSRLPRAAAELARARITRMLGCTNVRMHGGLAGAAFAARLGSHPGLPTALHGLQGRRTCIS